MRLQKSIDYEPLPFTQVFPEIENSSTSDFIFFVSHKGSHGFLSNWFADEAPYSAEGMIFCTPEQQIMFKKQKFLAIMRVC